MREVPKWVLKGAGIFDNERYQEPNWLQEAGRLGAEKIIVRNRGLKTYLESVDNQILVPEMQSNITLLIPLTRMYNQKYVI